MFLPLGKRSHETALGFKDISIKRVGVWLVPAVFFWLILAIKIPYSLTRFFHHYYFFIFMGVFIFYLLSFRLDDDKQILTGFGLTMLLFALTLSYLWTSGFSDNFLISGFLPYKDAKNYYQGAAQLLNGWPIRFAVNAVHRPLFSGFLSSLLLLTGQDLKLVLAFLAQLSGLGIYLSARQVRLSFGAPTGTILITFLYFYFQFAIGYIMSESLGFIGGCFAFALLWYAAQKRNWFDLLLGLSVLLLAVNARAGTFFIFPMLILWTGWQFRGEKRFSFHHAAVILVVILTGHYILNSVYSRSLGVPDGESFGNFSFSLYGQVRGGIGWHSAIDELGTSNPSDIYNASWNSFLANPADLFTGVMKAYADFFLPGERSIFAFGASDSFYSLDLILWGITIIILLRSLYILFINRHKNISSLLLAGFVGIFLSIPLLPPVDGGGRFYASTTPFFFVLFAIGINRINIPEIVPVLSESEISFLRFISVILLTLAVLLPPVTLRVKSQPVLNKPDCPKEQRQFVIQTKQNAYVDLLKDNDDICGLVPEVCYDDFLKHNTEMYTDDFYQELNTLAMNFQTGMRVIPTLNLLDGYFQYFIFDINQLPDNGNQTLLSGCATRTRTKNQRIFKVEMISPFRE